MHIEDYLSVSKSNDSNTNIIKSAVSEDTSIKEKAKSVEPLRSIRIEQPFYNAGDIKDESLAKDIASRLSSGQSGKDVKNRMALYASSMTKQDFSNLKEDGYSPMEMEGEEMVTIADKIRVQLAKAGADVSMMGGIKSDDLAAITGSEGSAIALENAMAKQKAGEVTDLSEDAKKYLVKNNLEPTIENVYQGTFSVSKKYESTEPLADISEKQLQELDGQIKRIISDSGMDVNDKNIGYAKELLKSGIPLTTESLTFYKDLSENDGIIYGDELDISINEAVIEGKSPQKAYILSGFSAFDQAKNAKSVIDNATVSQVQTLMESEKPLNIESLSILSDSAELKGEKESYENVNARRILEETRLLMSVEANYSLIKRGVAINTMELSDLVEELKAYENILYGNLYSKGDTAEEISDKKLTFNEVSTKVGDLKLMPAAALGIVISEGEVSINRLHQVGDSLKRKYQNAGERYEQMQTEVRKDLGDSIKKAFNNIDDILDDLAVEKNDDNRRAVRILGYNRLEITQESIQRIKQSDEAMQRTFKNMTPGVVAKMIKEGRNPLDLDLESLNELIESVKDESDSKYSADEYAKFLWKAEHDGKISDEQRESFVGIYRLINQVTQSDGAVIGHLLNQGVDITMRNMMMAIRTAKHENKETVIDDSFGFVSDFKKDDLSITQQIEMAFQTSKLKDAKESITPQKLLSMGGEEAVMPLTPSQLADTLSKMPEDFDMDEAYINQQMNEFGEAINSEKRIFEVLEKFDLPITPQNLVAMNSLYSDRNSIYRNLFGRKAFSQTLSDVDFENINPKEIMADIIRDFGEAVKTPTDMAEAQQKLEETAVNVMKTMMVERQVDGMDVNGMKVSVTQIQMLGKISRDTENYTVPIIVADEYGTLSLKIVRGSDEKKGLVDIAFDMETTGKVSASLRYEADGIRGSIACVSENTKNVLNSKLKEFEDRISAQTGLEATLSINGDSNLLLGDIFEEPRVDFETSTQRPEVQTRQLYSVAKSFIDTIGEIEF